MADSDKELSAIQALRKIECTHCMLKHTRECLQAGVAKSVMNHQDTDFAFEM